MYLFLVFCKKDKVAEGDKSSDAGAVQGAMGASLQTGAVLGEVGGSHCGQAADGIVKGTGIVIRD